MTIGETIFYSGFGLLGITILLALLFWLKKPQYIPESAANEGNVPGTQKLRNGYPTDRLTIRRDKPVATAASGTEAAQITDQERDAMPMQETVSISATIPVTVQETVLLQEEAVTPETSETVSLI